MIEYLKLYNLFKNIKEIMFKLLLFLFYFYSFFAISGPLDIEEIKEKCLQEFQTENSDEYMRCVKDEVNKNLYNKTNSD